MNHFLLKIFFFIFMVNVAKNVNGQCANNLINNGGFESGLETWWTWHDNNPDAYEFGIDSLSYAGESSAFINVLVSSADLTSTQGGEFNNRPDSISITAGVTYKVTFAARSSTDSTTISAWVRDEFDGWATVINMTFDIDTAWGIYSMDFTPEVDRADVHFELKAYTEGQVNPYTVWFDDISICDNSLKTSTCDGNLITNPGFEAFPQGDVDWWTWHGGTEDAYAFYTSDDAYAGDSSAVLDVLVNSASIPTGAAEYNNRGMIIPLVGGAFYEVSFAAKSTIDQAGFQVWVKDEFDGWFTVHNTEFTLSTEWMTYSFIFQADMDRDDIHLELKVYNADFEPYKIFFDEVAICVANPTTTTCSDNLISNPGLESGTTDWWTWHGGEVSDYGFSISADAAVADSAMQISVLKATADLSGTGEYNSRPQLSEVVAGQNYRVSVMAKSTLEGAGVQIWLKDEFDNWTTVANENFSLTTDWAEYDFIFVNDTIREDIHIELKVFTEGATEPYEVLFDEISICATDEEPGEEEPAEVFDFGSVDTLVSCSENMVIEFSETDFDEDGMGWETWDGSDSSIVVWKTDTLAPYSGSSSIRLDVPEDHQVAELHHRFGDRFNLVEGEEYTITLWARGEVPEGDTLRLYTRAVRDTDWKEPGHGNFMVLDNEWKNYQYTFTVEENYDNAFIDIKSQRWNTDFDSAYTVWFDDIQLCSSANIVTDIPSSTETLELLGVDIKASPNPVLRSQNLRLETSSVKNLGEVTIIVNDLLGKNIQISKSNISSGNNIIELETSHLLSGFYIATVHFKDYRKTIKFQVIE